ncbi:type I methionyl aminopeptidase [Cohnella sp. LGH]|uniref:Methionine aminopeptidase n=1 Tax=Cohnella phaseoli TaxID=456490 RepID=A0A3D9HZF9_9BACL|nr:MULTISPECIES: type I methionyl aminopeptidase [Cohnella]QTH41845.1 type I methionyl aminopeptidase [Cohnella sp. LGH]RED54887.1 methionine aminopeptidase type I [Cohnella phaseoli]
MIAQSPQDIDQLKKIGKIVALTIEEMKKRTQPGMTTRQLDLIGRDVLLSHGAASAPMKDVQFPGYTCISINEEVAHGIPGDRIIQAGDLVNVDVSAELEGYYADAGQSFQVAPVETEVDRLCRHTYATMMKVISGLKGGVKLNQIGKTMQEEAKRGGYRIIENLCSHGVGRSLHEEPFEILPYSEPRDRRVLKAGQVITIEPFVSTGATYVDQQADGWTLKVPDRSRVAQFEHTIIITNGNPIITTVC